MPTDTRMYARTFRVGWIESSPFSFRPTFFFVFYSFFFRQNNEGAAVVLIEPAPVDVNASTKVLLSHRHRRHDPALDERRLQTQHPEVLIRSCSFSVRTNDDETNDDQFELLLVSYGQRAADNTVNLVLASVCALLSHKDYPSFRCINS